MRERWVNPGQRSDTSSPFSPLSFLAQNKLPPLGRRTRQTKELKENNRHRGRLQRHQTYEGRMQMCTWAGGRSASWAVKEIVMASIMPLHSYWPPPAVQGILVQMNLNRPHKLFHSLQTDCNHRVAAIIMWRSHELGRGHIQRKDFVRREEMLVGPLIENCCGCSTRVPDRAYNSYDKWSFWKN